MRPVTLLETRQHFFFLRLENGMDPTALIFYAVVCGGLSMFAPKLDSPVKRLIVGALVGIAAALSLPMIRSLFNL